MLLMLQPFLAQLAAKAQQHEFDMGLIVTIGIIVAIFGIITTMAMRMGAGIASGFATSSDRKEKGATPPTTSSAFSTGVSPDRAEQIAARAAISNPVFQGEGAAPATRRAHESASAVADLTPVSQRLGQTYRRGSTPLPSPVGGA
jgi:hypothetical protein